MDDKKTNNNVWRCTVCGYIYDGDTLPKHFSCPVCKAPAPKFERVAKEKPNTSDGA